MEYFESIFGAGTYSSLLIILNLILIESLLSVDNAAVLATMVRNLPEEQQKKALRIGLILAYIFRGTCLILAAWLIKIAWLKLAGGLYLVYLCLHYYYKKYVKHKEFKEEIEEEIHDVEAVTHLPIEKKNVLGLNKFWSTVLMVEIMDLTFSLDNVFAAVAFTDNIYLICTGVFIGIITMRIVAGYFVKLMTKFPFLDEIAFLVIGILGIKLSLSYFCHGADSSICHLLENETADMYFSIGTMIIFFAPILSSILFNFPKRGKE